MVDNYNILRTFGNVKVVDVSLDLTLSDAFLFQELFLF
jgi:hypothetical protein